MPSTVTIQLTDEQATLLGLLAAEQSVTSEVLIAAIIARNLKSLIFRIKTAALSAAAAGAKKAILDFIKPTSVTITVSS